ncbi:MAG TPA: transposase [Candidatus Rubrimentiphilum sp.]|nr:transposase [Candidatus Rubrimentiphilum sp.]
MRKSRFTDAQIVGILKELDAGTPATELARRHAVHANTIRLWRDRYGGLETNDFADSSNSSKKVDAKTASSRGSRSKSTP